MSDGEKASAKSANLGNSSRHGEDSTGAQQPEFYFPDDIDLLPEAIHFFDKRARRLEKKQREWQAIQQRVLDTKKQDKKRQMRPRQPASKARPQDAPVSASKPASPVPEVRLEIAAAELPSHDLSETHFGIESFLKVER